MNEENKTSDNALLDALRKDPDGGMKTLIEQYAGLVYAVVRSRLLPSVFCEADAESCVSDTFGEFYCNLKNYDAARGSIKSYLCVIAKRNALDTVRKHYAAAETVSTDEENARQYADDFSLEGDFENRETRRELLNAVNALGEPDREIIVRKFYLGQSSKQITEKLNLTVSNVDTRTHRAIKKLRERFNE